MGARLRIDMAGGLLLSALFGACAPEPAGPVTATQAELERAVTDASFVGAMSDGSAICVYHAADGQLLGRHGGLITGTWSVEDGALCYVTTQGPDANACREAVFNGNRAVLLQDGEVAGQGTFSEGNVCG